MSSCATRSSIQVYLSDRVLFRLCHYSHLGNDIHKMEKSLNEGYLTATDIARYHVHFCQKYLWLSNNRRKSKALADISVATTSLDQARFKRGYKVSYHIHDTEHVYSRRVPILTCPVGRSTTATFGDGESHPACATAKDHY